MLARVTTFEGGTADGIRAGGEELNANVAAGPPPGVKSSGFTMLIDPEGGRVMMIGLFANEDDLNESEVALKAMNPPEGIGSMASRDVYDVAVEVRM